MTLPQNHKGLSSLLQFKIAHLQWMLQSSFFISVCNVNPQGNLKKKKIPLHGYWLSYAWNFLCTQHIHWSQSIWQQKRRRKQWMRRTNRFISTNQSFMLHIWWALSTHVSKETYTSLFPSFIKPEKNSKK